MRSTKAYVYCTWLLVLALALSGCANVHVEHDAASLGDKSIVFGRLLLIRDGEVGRLDAMGTQISLQRTDIQQEPQLVTEPFDSDGRFYWSMPPGKYLLSISLNVARGEAALFAFDVPTPGRAYYFGNVVISGKKTFSALNAPNIREAALAFEDGFDTEKAEFGRRYTGLSAPVEPMAVTDIGTAAGKSKYIRYELDSAHSCCSALSGLEYQPLGLDTPFTAGIGAPGGSYDFPSGKSFYAAFALPQTETPYVIALRSEVSDRGVPYRYKIFAPALMLLDESHQTIETLDRGHLRPVAASLLPPRRAALQADVLLTTELSRRARYLVLYTTPQLLTGSFLSEIPGVIALPAGLIGISGAHLVQMEPWHTGTVEVTLRRASLP